MWYSRLGKIRPQQINWTQISFCLGNYQYFTLPELIRLTFNNANFYVVTLKKNVTRTQLENFNASKETAKQNDLHNKASQLKIFKIGLTS